MVTGVFYSLTYGFSALSAGFVSDRFPRKRVLIAVGLCWNLTSFGNASAHTFGEIAFYRLLFGFFGAFSSTICYSLISDYFPPERRTLANACFTASTFLGIALSSLSQVLVGGLGWRSTYAICGVYGMIAVLLFALLVEDPIRGKYEAKKLEIIEEQE